jgi:hypothetical protein
MASLNTSAIIDAVVSDALATGLFESVNAHEPKSAPTAGLTASVWLQRIAPAVGDSGLGVTSGLLTLNLRIYTSMRSIGPEADDSIDPAVADATDALMALFGGGFTLGGLIRDVDLLGEFGTPLSGEAGYITIGGAMYRCMTITIPCVVNDVWQQAQ